MDFKNFELEHFQSQYERTVDYNLADSSVESADVRDLLDDGGLQAFKNLPLYYPEVNGSALLRERIAALYPGATAGNVLVTVGASEANALVCTTLLRPGDEVIVVSPGYRQVWGLARNAGCVVKELELLPEEQWRVDLNRLEALAGAKTRLISVVNPNNPTGTVLSTSEIERVVRICASSGAWLHADEVYRETELSGDPAPSFWGRYDRLICTNGLSKAYGLAGLRVGWALASSEMIEALWRRHEYAVIAGAGPSMMLAELALRPPRRAALLERQKNLARAGAKIVREWLDRQEGRFSWTVPRATSIAFVKYNFDMPSVELAGHIRRKVSVLVAPGAYLGTENHLRIAFGYKEQKILGALTRISTAVAEFAPERLAAG
jgi:aspartate/methionine/tyrosine aminotransferase